MDEEYKEEIFVFLDNLRESGVTNMYGAAPYIVENYDDVDIKTARSLLSEWMNTFEERHKEVV